MCIIHVVNKFENCVFFLNFKNNHICPCLHNIRLSYIIKKCISVLPVRMCMSTYGLTVNNCSFLFKDDENTCPKGRAIMHVYRVVSQTKEHKHYNMQWNIIDKTLTEFDNDNILMVKMISLKKKQNNKCIIFI